MLVPTKAASTPAASMIFAWYALGVPSTASTRSCRAMAARSRAVTVSAISAPRARRLGHERLIATVEVDGVVPEQLALDRLGQIPRHHRLDGAREPALAMRVVGGVHEDAVAE